MIYRRSRKEYLAHKKAARSITLARLQFFAAHYGITHGRISIRNQRTRWGSCSKKGNLNFNYRIALLPPELQDYLIVHELCHIKQFNHSPAFWDLVGQQVPEYKKLRSQLRVFGR